MSFKHGHTLRKTGFSPTYSTWSNMIQRCKSPKNISYKYCGSKGIQVCDSWLVFENFLKDMGARPSGHSLDRIDNSLGYYKENCRWATSKQQNQNRTNNFKIRHNGVEKVLMEWAEELKIPRQTLQSRLKRGWSVEEAFTVPPRFLTGGNTHLRAAKNN